MNSGFYTNPDINFDKALEMSETEYSHDELLKMLSCGNITQKQIAALKFDRIENTADASALLSNLTGCDGKIREAVAFKINEFVTHDKTVASIFNKLSPKIFADASVDINANICRLVIDTVNILKSDRDFGSNYIKYITNFAIEALEELDNFIFRDKKYVINKQLFKLYWCLEAIKTMYDFIPLDTLCFIMTKCTEQSEYTIREKAAEILSVNNSFPNLYAKLKDDENYYVREVLNHHSPL